MVSFVSPWGGETDAAHAYLYERKNGATLLSIALGHTGPYARSTGETIPATSHDQVLVQGTLESDAGDAPRLHSIGLFAEAMK